MVYRIGEHEGRTVDIQILSMTNRRLGAEMEAGRFRRDLYHRIAGARVRIPPLRERGDDILLLAERFATAVADKLGRVPVTFSTDAAALMMAYRWPGNVRELRNVVETTVALAESGLIEPTICPTRSINPTMMPLLAVACTLILKDGLVPPKASSQVGLCLTIFTVASNWLSLIV
jgi:DNA-binding NtrC family response regulator